MKRALIWVVVLVVLAGASFAGYRFYKSRSTPQTTYRTAAVKKTDIALTITATGTVVPEDVIDVGAQVNGQIAEFGVDAQGKPLDYRSEVKEGAVLAKIDEAIYQADLASSQAQLNQAKAQVGISIANRDLAKAHLEQTRRDWERAQRLGNTAALSKAEYDAAQSAFEQAVASVAVSEASITQAQASVAQSEANLQRSARNLAFCVIKSPVSGVIIDKRVDIGQTVVASLNAPSLFLIARDMKKMLVLVQVNEADVGSVTPAQAVRFTVDAFPGRSFRGEVRKVRLNASMTQNVVTYTVEISTENADLKLLPYLTANVKFEVAKREGVLGVPNAALRWTPKTEAAAPTLDAPARGPGQGSGGGGQGRKGDRDPNAARPGTIYVLQNGIPQPLQIKAGLSDGTMTEVSGDGLSEGLEVVVGEQASGQSASAAATGATNPFAPPMMRGGGGGGGRPGR
jgi:HlyD family secretion protein